MLSAGKSHVKSIVRYEVFSARHCFDNAVMTTVSATSSHIASTQSASSVKLVKGASGAAVKELQQLLKQLGFYKSNVDGKFGPVTEAAVKAFQKSRGLTVDGWAGPQTMNALRKAAAPPPPPPASTTLQQGSSGNGVKEVQLILTKLGHYKGVVGGNYGAQTAAAVKAFQTKHGLPATGKVDTTTLAKLRQVNQQPATPPRATPGTPLLQQGSTGNGVKEVQMILTALGHYSGAIGGNYGAQTAAGVKAFQSKHGLPATGNVDAATLAKLREVNAARPTTPTTPVGVLQPGQAVTPPALPANGFTGTVQPPGLVKVPASASKEQKLAAVLNFGIYWANLEAQKPGSTAYVGGASSYRDGGVGTGGSARQSNQSRYRSPAGVVGFDCSGFVRAMFAQAGITVAGNSSALKSAGNPVSWNGGTNGLQPGDILSKNGHVVVYIGNGQVVESTPFNKVQVGTASNGEPIYQARGVKISSVNDFTPGNGYVARRVL